MAKPLEIMSLVVILMVQWAKVVLYILSQHQKWNEGRNLRSIHDSWHSCSQVGHVDNLEARQVDRNDRRKHHEENEFINVFLGGKWSSLGTN